MNAQSYKYFDCKYKMDVIVEILASATSAWISNEFFSYPLFLQLAQSEEN